MLSPNVATPEFVHIGLFVKNADAEAASMVNCLGAKLKNTVQIKFDEKMKIEVGGNYELKIAFVELGGVSMELIQLVDGPGSYFDEYWKSGGKGGFHHLFYSYPTEKDYKAVYEAMIAEGYKRVLGSPYFSYMEHPETGLVFEINMPLPKELRDSLPPPG